MYEYKFHSMAELKEFCKENAGDARAHWYYGPFDTFNGDCYTISDLAADIAGHGDEFFGTEEEAEVYDMDIEEEDYPRIGNLIVALKNGALYALSQVTVEDFDNISGLFEKYATLGFERASEKAFAEDLNGLKAEASQNGKNYFAFISKETIDWIENHCGYAINALEDEEEDYPF